MNHFVGPGNIAGKMNNIKINTTIPSNAEEKFTLSVIPDKVNFPPEECFLFLEDNL
jgi:hypothetical protein